MSHVQLNNSKNMNISLNLRKTLYLLQRPKAPKDNRDIHIVDKIRKFLIFCVKKQEIDLTNDLFVHKVSS